MKYHSIEWWFTALKGQMKSIIRNKICREYLKIEFGFTKADLLTMYIEQNKYMLYRVLTRKYPEFKRLEKYLKIDRAFTNLEFVSAGIFYQSSKQISTFWIYEANIEDIYFLLKLGIGCIVQIKNALDQPHSITILAYDDENGNIIFNDPLGDPFSKYRIRFGFNIVWKKEKLLSCSLGNPIRMSFVVNNDDIEIIEKINNWFSNRNLYSMQMKDFEGMRGIDYDKIILSQYSIDGKITINLGEKAKGKFINCFIEYNDEEDIFWAPEYDTINEIIVNVLNERNEAT